MIAVKGFYDGNMISMDGTLPVTRQCEVIITFLDTAEAQASQQRIPIIHSPKHKGAITDDYFADIGFDTQGFIFNRDEANER
jgi:hypothetical protein